MMYFTLYRTRVIRKLIHAISRNSSLRGIAYSLIQKNTNQIFSDCFAMNTNKNNLVYDDIYKIISDEFYLHFCCKARV